MPQRMGLVLAALAWMATAGAQVVTWGDNSVGQLGDGTVSPTPRLLAAAVPGLEDAQAIAAKGNFTLVLMRDGSVRAWGDNVFGQLGDGTTTLRSSPITVTGLPAGIRALSAGNNHALALLNDGTVWGWGSNLAGQLGVDPAVSPSFSVPTLIPGLAGVQAVDAGFDFTLFLLSDGTVRALGKNQHSQLGNNSTVDSFVPVTPVGLSNVTALAAGRQRCIVLLANGTCMAWGNDQFTALGGPVSSGMANCPVPVPIVGLANITAIALNAYKSSSSNSVFANFMARRNDGVVYFWGSSNYFPLGAVVGNNYVTQPTILTGVSTCRFPVSGTSGWYLVMNDGAVRTWGLNSKGQLGDGTTVCRLQPDNITSCVGLAGTAAMVAGADHGVAIMYPAPKGPGDVNGDGVVNVDDLNSVTGNFGRTYP